MGIIETLSLPSTILKLGFVVISLTLIIRRYIAGGVCRSNARLDGKTVIITGGNSGIGKETAFDLAKRGARVILACRDLNTANDALNDIKKASGNDNIIVKKIDLSSFESVKAFADATNKEEERIDILINNAGQIITIIQVLQHAT